MRPPKVSDQQILTAARECFLEHGPAVSTTVIARQLDVSQATLFKRFGTKQQLMIAALTPSTAVQWFKLVERGPDDRPVQVQLVELAEQIQLFFDEMIPCMSVLHASGVDMREMLRSFDEPPPLKARRLLCEWFERARERGLVGPINSEVVTLAFLGGLQSRSFMHHVSDGLLYANRNQLASQLVEALWAGLAPVESP